MTGKEITDLSVATVFENGDLISLRKSGQIEDKAISFENVLKSIGNTAVDGFVASSTEANKIILNSVNGVAVDQYYNGMKISFVSPFKSTGVVQVKVGSLTYKNLLAYKSTSSVVIDKDDYIEAVLIGEAFYQVNNAQYIYTNDYVIETYEFAQGDVATTIYLSSAYGVRKASYYKGMTINFVCPIDTKGAVRVNIDGLGVKDISDDADDFISTPLYQKQTILATYDSEKFVKSVLSPTKNLVIPTNILIVDDQPVSTAVTLEVGPSKAIKKLLEAINYIIVENAKDKGKAYKIVLDSDFTLNEEISIYDKDLGDTTITSNGAVINCNLIFDKHSIATIFFGSNFKLKFDNIKFKINSINKIKTTAQPVFIAMFYPDNQSEITLNNVSFISAMVESTTLPLTVLYLGGGLGGDKLIANNVTVTECDVFLQVHKGANVKIDNSVINTRQNCISVNSTNCTIENTTIVSKVGIQVGYNSIVNIKNVNLNGVTPSNQLDGIYVNYQAAVTLNNVTINNYGVAIRCAGSANIQFIDGSISNFYNYGIYCLSNSTVTATNIIIKDTTGQISPSGARVQEVSKIILKSCTTGITNFTSNDGTITVL